MASRLSNGLDSIVGEGGNQLSGGEKQIISLARALLKDADVYMFDEATAHIDKETQGLFYGVLRTRLREKTCIVISHGQLVGDVFDDILEMKAGEVVRHTRSPAGDGERRPRNSLMQGTPQGA
jgi:ATP-binding cassette subfamily B protein